MFWRNIPPAQYVSYLELDLGILMISGKHDCQAIFLGEKHLLSLVSVD